jgi:transcriptional regulator with XRE-family HTH domain
MATVGQNIVKLRVDRKMNQKALCKATGLAQRYMSGLEHGHIDPRLSVVCMIAKALQVTPSELLAGVEDVEIEMESAVA